MEWDQTPVCVSTICATPSKLPLLARIAPRDLDVDDVTPRAATHDVIYLLYAVRECAKIKCVELSSWQQYSETGNIYMIPSTYQGWFQAATEPKHLINCDMSMHNIEEVVTSQTSVYMTHQPLRGFIHTRQRTFGKLHMVETTIAAGDLLTVGAIFCNPSSDSICCISRLCREKLPRDQQDELYLQCHDQKGTAIIVPLYTAGKFSMVAHKNCEFDDNCIFNINQLEERQYKLPLMVKLVRGTPPYHKDQDDTSQFSGLLQLQEKSIQVSLIACCINTTATDRGMAFVEFPQNSGIRFNIAQNWGMDCACPVYIMEALKFCDSNIESFKSEIQRVTTKISPLNDTNVQQKPNTKPKLPKRSMYFSQPTPKNNEKPSVEHRYDALNVALTRYRCKREIELGSSKPVAVTPNAARKSTFTETAFTVHPAIGRLNSNEGRSSNFEQHTCCYSSTDSAPSMPPPAIPAEEHTLATAFDDEGFLIPLENRTIGMATVSQDIIPPPAEFQTGTDADIPAIPQWELYTNISPPPFQQHSTITCDPEQLDSFLNDSIAAVNQRVANRKLLDRQHEDLGHVGPSLAVSAENIFPQLFPCTNESIDNDAEDVLTLSSMQEIHTDFPALRASYHGFGSLAKTDSGHGTLQCLGAQNYSQELFMAETWVPRSDAASMSVEEVVLGLQYIGTRKSLLSKFADERIDGKLLTELTDELLHEGFPEMNALERKKVLDFARGWRPKRTII